MCKIRLSFMALIFLAAGWNVRAGECPDLSGRWHGEWVSCTDGHRGALSARIWQVNEDCYQARFSGTFFGVIPFTFRATLSVTGREDGRILLSTSKRLPVFGTFCLSAVATSCDFTATYTSKDDEGRFTLRR